LAGTVHQKAITLNLGKFARQEANRSNTSCCINKYRSHPTLTVFYHYYWQLHCARDLYSRAECHQQKAAADQLTKLSLLTYG